MSPHDDLPADLPTVAQATLGQIQRIRHVLRGARPVANRLEPGTVVRCVDVTPDTVILEVEGGSRIVVDRMSARHLQVEDRFAPHAAPLLAPHRIRRR